MSSAAESTPSPETTAALGETLAVWLESLGLVEGLKGAGLPTMVRDCHGRATWRDPGTGEALTHQQLEDLDRMLHDNGDEPAHGVPIALVQLVHRARVRAELLTTEVHTYETLAALRGESVPHTRFDVHKASGRGELLVVPQEEGDSLVPAFQLDRAGRIRPELVPVLQALASPTADAWATWGWLTRPAALLSGGVPEQVVRDPEEAPLVAYAASKLAAHR